MIAVSIFLQTTSGGGAPVLCHGVGGSGAGGDHSPLLIPPLRTDIHRIHGPQATGAVDIIHQTESQTCQAGLQAAALAYHHPVLAR